MAPHSIHKPARKSQGRMIQPALPALPFLTGPKSKQTKIIAPEPEPQVTHASLPQESTENDEKIQTSEVAAATDPSQAAVSRIGSLEEKKVSVSTGQS